MGVKKKPQGLIYIGAGYADADYYADDILKPTLILLMPMLLLMFVLLLMSLLSLMLMLVLTLIIG